MPHVYVSLGLGRQQMCDFKQTFNAAVPEGGSFDTMAPGHLAKMSLLIGIIPLECALECPLECAEISYKDGLE